MVTFYRALEDWPTILDQSSPSVELGWSVSGGECTLYFSGE